MVFSYAMFRDLQKTQTVFTGIAAHVGCYFPVLELQPDLSKKVQATFSTDSQ